MHTLVHSLLNLSKFLLPLGNPPLQTLVVSYEELVLLVYKLHPLPTHPLHGRHALHQSLHLAHGLSQ